jgi:hypothetical protein
MVLNNKKTSNTPIMALKSLDLSPYPPAPIAWAYTVVDTVCEPVGCGHWRQWLPNTWTQKGEWLSDEFQLAPVNSLIPPLLTYQEYLQQTPASTAVPYSWNSLQTFAFETPSTSLADLTSSSSILVLCILVIVLRRVKAVLMPLFSQMGTRAARVTHGKEWLKDNQVRIVKFGEYVFRLLIHSLLSAAGIWYFWDKEWWAKGNTRTLYLEYPHQPIAPGMIWYYLVQSAYNIEAMASLLELSFCISWNTKKQWIPLHLDWSKTVRGDFQEMCIHHVVTNLLVVGSSFFRFTRVGSMVFLVHDISDVPVDLSKLANFLKWKATTAMCFASLVIVWCMTRLGALPWVIYKSVLYESWMVCSSGVIDPIYYVFYRPFFVVLIGLLITLHLAWFVMFIQMGYVLISKGEAHDLSEHKKGEIQQPAVTGKKAQ